jgi:hypothetical protein
MTNGDNGTGLIDEIMRSISRTYGWPDFKPEEMTLVPIPVTTLDSYAGRYKEDGGSYVFRIERSGNEITFAIEGPGGLAFSLFPVSSDTFLVRSSGLSGDIRFTKDGGDDVSGFRFTPKSGGGSVTASKF